MIVSNNDNLVTVVELNVPSGKIAILNNLRETFGSDSEIMMDAEQSYGSVYDEIEYIEQMAEKGCACGFCSDPVTVFREGNDFGSFTVAKTWINLTNGDSTTPTDNSIDVAYIDSFQRYYMIDYDNYISLGGSDGFNSNIERNQFGNCSFQVFDVDAGLYRVSYFGHKTRNNVAVKDPESSEQVVACLEKVGS